MSQQSDAIYRRGLPSDAFGMMNLYQRVCVGTPSDSLLLNYKDLLKALNDPEIFWFVGEQDSQLVALITILVDTENRLGKVNRLVLDPTLQEGSRFLEGALPLLLKQLEPDIDVLYTTTRYLTLAQQQMTLRMGFKLLGIFPNAVGQDHSRVNGFTAYYFDGVLHEKRQASYLLHPVLEPFFNIVRPQCDLDDLTVLQDIPPIRGAFEPVPPLEMIYAPNFVRHRFAKLNERKSLSIHFYPFQEPNALITGPQQKIEVFVRLNPENRFAAIIGERLDTAVDPTLLYDRVSQILNQNGITYVEMINDAGDVTGIDCINRAGFLPTVYIPAFKKQGDQRRDYVVLARAFERLLGATHIPTEINATYFKFLTEYYQLEEAQYLSGFIAGAPPEHTPYLQ